MSNTQKQADSSLLWDCFTNWSLTLEKIMPPQNQETKLKK